ncbi:MAG: BON domain-containing protein [Betaproteobacteria bacterium]|nr:MAG: BON domain-containing protein [Betaproteobacteria bacterium]
MLPWQTVRVWRRFPVGLMGSAALVLGIVVALAPDVRAQEPRTYQLDPFTQATAGYAGCPEAKPPVLSEQEMRTTAHQRVERGTSCCLAGTCECGGAYKRDPEINDRVAQAVRDDRRFRDTSVWITTTRKFVTLQGCARNTAQKKALERLVKRQTDVAIVWNETTVGLKRKP